jgi:D-arabinose 1-dehydrogenase-like Zn-dependent alcohol dehydrogenase
VYPGLREVDASINQELINPTVVAVQYAKAMGFKVIGLDVSNAQLEDVKARGADLIFNTMEDSDFETKLKKATGGGCHAAAVFSAANAAYETGPTVLR